MPLLEQECIATPQPAILILAQSLDGTQAMCEVTHGNVVIIGSSKSCSLTLSGNAIASMHCLISFHDSRLELHEWSSVGGILVNGQPISGDAELNVGDQVGIGDHILTFQSCPPPMTAAASDNPINECFLEDSAQSDSGGKRGPSLPLIELAQDISDRDDSHVASEHVPSMFPHSCVDSADDEVSSVFLDIDAAMQCQEMEHDDEMTVLLRAEIRELQGELAERDAQIEELLRGSSEFDSAGDGAPDDAKDDSSLVVRLDELLDELAKSDERIAMLEELLTASEEVADAEREERRQLVAWVSAIDQRIATRESEWQAEIEGQRQQIALLKSKRDRAEHQLQKAASASNTKTEYEHSLQQLREENGELERKLAEMTTANRILHDKLESADVQNNLMLQKSKVDVALREERARLAQERAELARKRADMANEVAEIQKRVHGMENKSTDVDSRVRVLREHLTEIHQQEGKSSNEHSLTSRIAAIWRRLDG